MMELITCIEDYLRFIKHEQGVSRNTVKAYHTTFYHFRNWLTTEGYPTPTIADFNAATVRRYFYANSARGLRPRTLHNYMVPLRSFGAYLLERSIVQENPGLSVKLPKKDAANRTEASEADIIAMMHAIERQRNPRKVAFQRAVMAVLIYTGVRRAELCDLLLSDVDLQQNWLLVRSGKGSKSRKIPLCEPARDAIAAYLPHRPQDCTHPYLFAVDRKRRLYFNGLRSVVEEAKALAGIAGKKELTPHCLRHACASRLMRQGGSLLDVMTWLGHTQINTTQRYLHTTEEQLQRIADKARLASEPQPDNVIDIRDRQRQADSDRQRTRRRIAR